MVPKSKERKKGKKASGSKRPPGSASRLPTQSSAMPANGPSACANIPADLQQEILNAFLEAFSSLTSSINPNELKERIQRVKGALYDRDFETAFSTIANQQAYCLRWSPARALAYTELVLSIPQLFDNLLGNSGRSWDDTSNDKVDEGPRDLASSKGERLVLSIGGGAGAELVAFAAALRRHSQSQMLATDGKPYLDEISCQDGGKNDREGVSDSDESRPSNGFCSVHLKAIDIADWSHALKSLFDTLKLNERGIVQQGAVTSAPNPTNDSADAVQHQNEQYARLEKFEFINRDILNMAKEELQTTLATESPQTPPLITIFFTLNELYSASMSKTTALLLNLTDLVPKGTQLLVVDSPGSYSTVGLNGSTEKKYPMHWLLDHTLLEATRRESAEDGATRGERERLPVKWDKIGSEESRWWRMDRSALKYEVPGVELENMRMQWHYYRRL